MIFQNDFDSSKEVASPREPEPKPFLEKPEPCQSGPQFVDILLFYQIKEKKTGNRLA
jgi:hypothetical protein